MKWWGWVIAGALLVALVAYWQHQVAQALIAQGRIKELTRSLSYATAAADSLSRIAAKTDTVWRTQYVTYTTPGPRDTMTVHDTVYIRKDIADATVGACSVALTSCQRAGVARDSVIADLRAINAALAKKPGPCRVLNVRCEIITGAAGLAAGVLLAK